MFAFIEGKVCLISEGIIAILCNGVGYEIIVSKKLEVKNDDNIKPKKMRNKAQVYEVPAVIRKEKEEISFEKALVWAFILHPAVILILLLYL